MHQFTLLVALSNVFLVLGFTLPLGFASISRSSPGLVVRRSFDGFGSGRTINDDDEEEERVKRGVGPVLSYADDDDDIAPIITKQFETLPLSEENVQGVLGGCRREIGSVFGYEEDSSSVGITGGVSYVDLDGPTVIVELHGRFWHERTHVLDRVKNYLITRIPEIVDVIVEDEATLSNEANEEAV